MYVLTDIQELHFFRVNCAFTPLALGHLIYVIYYIVHLWYRILSITTGPKLSKKSKFFVTVQDKSYETSYFCTRK